MRNIILPKQSNEAVDLGCIDTFTKGIIIAYKNSQPVGSGEWYFISEIDWDSYEISQETLHDLVDGLITDKTADEFKLMEFKRK